jgi:SSS family solute:Na+ symporter
MTLLDWTILTLYCLAILGLAIHFQRRASGGLVDFFAAGRDLPWWVIGFADVAGYTGGGQGFVMLLFLSGFSGLWLMAWLSWVIWMPLVAIIWAPMWRRLGVVTTGEFIERRYAGPVARNYRTVYALYACFVWGLTSVAYVASWMAATAAPLLGWTPSKVLFVFGAVTIAYTLVAGLFAVAYNDVFQFVILMAGNLVFGLLLMERAGGAHAVLVRLAAVRGENFLAALPSGSELGAITVLALCVQGLFFAGSPFAGEGWTAQRFMAARDERHAVLGQVANGVLALTIRLVPFIVIAFAAAALLQPSQVPVPATLWADLVKQYAPPGLFGLLLVSSLAGYMAAISSIGNWAASYLVNDIYVQRLRPNADPKRVVSVSRWATGILLGIAFLLGALIRADQLDKWVLFINSSLIVFSLPLAWLKWFWWRTTGLADMVGVLGGFPAGYLVWFGSDAVLPKSIREWLTRRTHWNWNGLVPAFSNLDRFPFWEGFAILFFSGCLVILLVTWLTKPEPMEKLIAFYQRARPIGCWGPVIRALPEQERRKQRNLTELGFAAFSGVAFYFLLTTALFEGMGGHIFSCVAYFGASLVAGYVFISRSIPSMGQLEGSRRDL